MSSSQPLRVVDDAVPDSEPEILLVDPDRESRAILCGMVAPLARIAEAHSGEEALRIGVSSELAAILIDVHLPGEDAHAIVTKLRRHHHGRNVPVLFLSAEEPDWITERRGYELGALGFLMKPVDANELRAKLEVLLTLHRRGAELRRRERMIAKQHTEIIQAKAALEQASAANRTKDLYLGVLGHDLRNPLSAMLMSARMMLMGQTLGAKDRESVLRIARNGERMAALIRDIIDYTRGQAAGGIPIIPRRANMGEICASMIDEISLLHGNRKIHLERAGDLVGEWDRERVEQVISNLLANALTHGVGELRVTATGSTDEVTVAIHNTGKAIPAEQMATIFEPFRQGSNSGGGLGLGLFIVHEILRAHGGSVDVQSTAETGTTFTTCWPRHAPKLQGART
ncbi:MAG: hybrid sensor histidine kinase/response regulator [Deltaproteobacteria bacterium]|nr:hybrid sensor histidine kinase/response regulator [Deltaproteobacteria bacterium]MDQ3301364.1 hybrid sensor histidine kinase/response regulator [Myxococcota bacterium]